MKESGYYNTPVAGPGVGEREAEEISAQINILSAPENGINKVELIHYNKERRERERRRGEGRGEGGKTPPFLSFFYSLQD